MPKSSRLCVDASLVVRVATRKPNDRTGQWIRQQWHDQRVQLVAPGLMPYEVTNALHRLTSSNPAGHAGFRRALVIAQRLPIALYHESWLHPRAMDFAERFHLPAAYDAHYLALADHLSCEFWTADKRLANTVGHTLTWVRLVEIAP